MSSHPVKVRGWNFESLMWLFLRLSGLGLYLIALIGLGTALYLGARTNMDLGTLLRWTFFPISTHLASSELTDLAPWTGGLWKTLQSLALVFGVTHGVNGLRNVIEDFFGHSKAKPIIRLVLVLLWAFILFAAFNLVATTD
jgi:succinate dehydrogenase hydrophobic anchor subunit